MGKSYKASSVFIYFIEFPLWANENIGNIWLTVNTVTEVINYLILVFGAIQVTGNMYGAEVFCNASCGQPKTYFSSPRALDFAVSSRIPFAGSI